MAALLSLSERANQGASGIGAWERGIAMTVGWIEMPCSAVYVLLAFS